MFGFGPFGSSPFGTLPDVARSREKVALTVSSLIIPERHVADGVLVRSTAAVWSEIAKHLAKDWSLAFQLSPRQWEEMVAGAFAQEGYEVTLTPRSADGGKDVIAVRRGIGCVKILGSVKANAAHVQVGYDDVRAIAGVVLGDPKASKGIITTTAAFPPKIMEDPTVRALSPTRLELVDGEALQEWLTRLVEK
jgi:restriction system protein